MKLTRSETAVIGLEENRSMGLSDFLHKILNKFTMQNDAIFTSDIKEQKDYLAKLPEPRNNLERSYFQYLCQMHVIKNPIIRVGFNFASFFIIPIYLLKSKDKIENNHKNTIFFSDGKPATLIPITVKKDDNDFQNIDKKKEYLDARTYRFIFQIWAKYPLSFYFILKIIIKLRYYCYAIQKYAPSRIIVCSEYSFTSSILTDYCKLWNVEHINVMHGEKLFYIRDSFFSFDKFYIWDDYYRSLFIKMRAEENQFVVEVPEALKFSNTKSIPKELDYTYYLGAEGDEDISSIVSTLQTLAQKGYRVSIRPHPRYTMFDFSTIKEIGIIIEDTHEISIETSLMRTKHAISLYSSVLNQAYHNGIPVVIDDLTNKEKYLKLKELMYVILNYDHRLLSAEVTLAQKQ